MWTDSKRHYHNINHLIDILTYIEKNRNKIESYNDYICLLLASFMHDVYYVPSDKFNEDKCIDLLKRNYISSDITILKRSIELIETTKYRKIPTNKTTKLFWLADNSILLSDLNNLKKYENNIRKEFSFVNDRIYKEKRIEFLKSNLGMFGKTVDDNILNLINFVENIYKK